MNIYYVHWYIILYVPVETSFLLFQLSSGDFPFSNLENKLHLKNIYRISS